MSVCIQELYFQMKLQNNNKFLNELGPKTGPEHWRHLPEGKQKIQAGHWMWPCNLKRRFSENPSVPDVRHKRNHPQCESNVDRIKKQAFQHNL